MDTDEQGRRALATLSVGALGVVFGDIGTSPLYAFRESLAGDNGLAVDEANILGVLSLMFWSLVVVITIKYLLIVMRADNHGEGGILALAALVRDHGRARHLLVLLGLFGTALLYGDGMITPAISVLSALEGIGVAAPAVAGWVVPIVLAILVGLFSVQRHGTETIGRLFGPVMLVWFSTLSLLGVVSIFGEPSVLRGLSPTYAIAFFAANGLPGFLVLGTVFLVVTGGEALYADMGHFGRRPIAAAWFTVVLPALTINYFGQGALLLRNPDAIDNPFYLLAPGWAQWPLTALATLATIIASQALITGAFSLTVQAANLGYLPPMRTVHTSEEHPGQVYVPAINWFLLVACLGLVVAFGSSANLAAAYGVAVTLTMVVTTLIVAAIAVDSWGWSPARTGLVLVPLLVVDLAFAGANVFKIPDGGWFPLLVGGLGYVVLTTWARGRRYIARAVHHEQLSTDAFVASLAEDPPARHPGTAVYLHRRHGTVPPALLSNLRHAESLHEHVVLVSVTTLERPHAAVAARDHLTRHPLGFHELDMRYGYRDRVQLVEDLRNLVLEGLTFDEAHTTYFLSRERIEVEREAGRFKWRERLFALLNRNAADQAARFGLPPQHSVDIGARLTL